MRPYFTISILTLLLGVSMVLAEGFTIPAKRQHALAISSVTLTRSPRITSQSKSPIISSGMPRGGASSSSSSSPPTLLFATDPSASKCPVSQPLAVFASFWGSLGVVYILAKAIKRVLPIALEPFGGSLILTPVQWSFYAISCLFFAYAEGYKGFQLKFAPLVVKRSFSLIIGTKQGSVLNYLLAPMYSMGLVHATKKRMITSWCVSLGVAAIVAAVKRLPGPWRSIVDAGVVVGLTWGSLSILYFFVKSWMTGEAPSVDACLPEDPTPKSS